jgi:AcrR family transcriptional regulator
MSVRDQLLDAALKVYAETGYRGATTRRIAGAAGVNEITLFRHFGSKDALIKEAITRAGASEVPDLLPDTPRDPFNEIRNWARAHLGELLGGEQLSGFGRQGTQPVSSASPGGRTSQGPIR